MKCKDKVAIVTGSTGKGMRRSLALTLARDRMYEYNTPGVWG